VEFVIAVVVILIVVCSALLVRRGSQEVDGHELTPTEEPDISAADAVVYEDHHGSTVVLEPLSDRPSEASLVPAGVASQLFHEASKLAPQLHRAAQGGGREMYRLMHSPPGGLQRVAGNPAHVRGFGYQGGHVSGHAEFKRVPSASISPALALAAASAILGAYWQQQIDDKLRGIQTMLDGIRSRLDAELDAKLDLAERTLTEHEAASIVGRYEPPASITDGLQANLVERRQLRRLLGKLESIEGQRLRHRDYHAKVLNVNGERLDLHVYRALRGLAVELRVLRLKRLGGLLETPAYRETLDRQEDELREQLELIGELLDTSLAIRGSRRVEPRRPELPAQRRARQDRELLASTTGRQKLHELSDLTRQISDALPPTDLTQGPVALVLEFKGADAAVYALPNPQRSGDEEQTT
jgi:hypothetical protein